MSSLDYHWELAWQEHSGNIGNGCRNIFQTPMPVPAPWMLNCWQCVSVFIVYQDSSHCDFHCIISASCAVFVVLFRHSFPLIPPLVSPAETSCCDVHVWTATMGEKIWSNWPPEHFFVDVWKQLWWFMEISIMLVSQLHFNFSIFNWLFIDFFYWFLFFQTVKQLFALWRRNGADILVFVSLLERARFRVVLLWIETDEIRFGILVRVVWGAPS